jgi:hypothetical protein
MKGLLTSGRRANRMSAANGVANAVIFGVFLSDIRRATLRVFERARRALRTARSSRPEATPGEGRDGFWRILKMAVVQFGVSITSIKGTIGGITFGNTSSGPTAHVKAQPATSHSSRVRVARNAFAECALVWKSLTSGQQSAWSSLASSPPETDYDRYGNVIFLSGKEWFIRVNVRRQTVSLPIIKSPVDEPRPSFPLYLYFSATESGPSVTATFTEDIHGDGNGLVVYSAPVINPERIAVVPNISIMTALALCPVSPVDLTSDYLARWGTPTRTTGIQFQTFVQSPAGYRSIVHFAQIEIGY